MHNYGLAPEWGRDAVILWSAGVTGRGPAGRRQTLGVRGSGSSLSGGDSGPVVSRSRCESESALQPGRVRGSSLAPGRTRVALPMHTGLSLRVGTGGPAPAWSGDLAQF
ncbi:hypothetical protein NN561_014916 [Cricetulus griseus]